MLTQSNKSKQVTEMTFKGHWRSSEISWFDGVHMISYYHSIVLYVSLYYGPYTLLQLGTLFYSYYYF